MLSLLELWRLVRQWRLRPLRYGRRWPKTPAILLTCALWTRAPRKLQTLKLLKVSSVFFLGLWPRDLGCAPYPPKLAANPIPWPHYPEKDRRTGSLQVLREGLWAPAQPCFNDMTRMPQAHFFDNDDDDFSTRFDQDYLSCERECTCGPVAMKAFGEHSNSCWNCCKNVVIFVRPPFISHLIFIILCAPFYSFCSCLHDYWALIL